MKTFFLIDYKGKFDYLQDKDRELDVMDFVSGEITHERAMIELEDRFRQSVYYGIPCAITDDEEINAKLKELTEEYNCAITDDEEINAKLKELEEEYITQNEKSKS